MMVVIVDDEVFQQLPPPVTGADSLKISLKKVLREQATAAGMATLLALCALLYDPAVIVPMLQRYLPAVNAVVGAQIISMLARVIVDQFRHNKASK